jgi:hypothetical protein
VIVQVTVPPDSDTVVPVGTVPVDAYVTPVGSGSVTTTPDALSGPSPVTVNVYVSWVPTAGSAVAADFCSSTFATGVGVIVADADAEVAPDVSGVVADWVSVAVLTIAVVPVTVTLMTSCKEAGAAMVPTVQVTVSPDSDTVVPAGGVPVDT